MIWTALVLALGAQVDKKAPPLPPPAGNVVWAKDAAGLKRALEGAAPDSTVMVADGTYKLPQFIYMRDKRNVTVRGASGNPDKVVLSARGWEPRDEQDDILRIGSCRNITVAHLTFTDCHSYGIKVEGEGNPEGIHIYDCRFRDIGMRAIKGSATFGGKAAGGSIRYCRFENTKVPPADWLFGGDYITAIDLMVLDGWTISDNFFKDIRGRTGNARGAVFVWVRSKNVTVERNVFVNCDRGVSFGNPSGSTAYRENAPHVSDSVIRNNFIVPGKDAGIELWWAENVKVYHNTVWRPDAEGWGLRGGGDRWKIDRVDVANNLVRGTIMLTGGVTLRNNVTAGLDGIFADAKTGDLRLTAAAAVAVGKALPLPEVTDDFDGNPRDPAPDLGASEFGVRKKAAAPEPARKEGPVARKAAGADAFAAWEARLLARMREELAAGRKPRFQWTATGDWADVTEIGPKGDLRIQGRDGGASVKWASVSLADRRNLAVGLARKDRPADCALAAFFLLALGEEERARPFLEKAGPAADEVKGAFR